MRYDNLKGEKNSAEFTVRMLSACDDYGRSFSPAVQKKADKPRFVGLFYFLWLGCHPEEMRSLHDVTELLKSAPSPIWDRNAKESPCGQYHFWGKPVFGYYRSEDEWVLRRHIILLTLASVDFLAFDVTNGFEYLSAVNVLIPIMEEYRREGWQVPRFMFYTNTRSSEAVGRLYESIYKKGLYRELWFAPNGKPMIAAITKDNGGASDYGERGAVTDGELLSFFEIKESQWPNTYKYNENGFPWIDFERPQRIYGDTVNVSVAQHNCLPFSDGALSKDIGDKMWGRGYTSDRGADHSEQAIYSGANFEEEWKRALEADPTYIFVTGWNEWVALKQYGVINTNGLGERTFFVDAFNLEYSRDIEPMSGGYFDNFYLQLIRNIRKYKFENGAPKPFAKRQMIAGEMKCWEGAATYKNFKNMHIMRDSGGFCPPLKYTGGGGNDIEEVRVAHDGENLYFLMCMGAPVLAEPEAERLNIEIIIKGKKSVIKPLKDAKPTQNKLLVCVPRKEIGAEDSFEMRFKINDGEACRGGEALYTGISAPIGRLYYTYCGE